MDINSVTRDYAQCISSGAITEPTGGTWVSAAAIYLGQTTPVNNSWLQALCIANGITSPVYGSWVIALADDLGITQPLNGSWWYAIANEACNGAPPTPTDLIWNLTDTNWDLEEELWDDIPVPAAPVWTGFTTTDNPQPQVNGTAEVGATIEFVIDGNTYTDVVDANGDWTITIINDLVGAASPGNSYVGSATATISGITSPATTGTIISVSATAVYEFVMEDTYGDGWNGGYVILQKETSPGVFTDVNFNGTPYRFNNNTDMANDTNRQYYATDTFVSAFSGPAGLRFESRDSGDPSFPSTSSTAYNGPVSRFLDIEAGNSYRIVVGNGGQYTSERTWKLYDGFGTLLFTKSGGSGWTPIGTIQYTFTT